MAETKDLRDEYTIEIPLNSEAACVYLFGEAGRNVWHSLQNNPTPKSQCVVTGVDVPSHTIYLSTAP